MFESRLERCDDTRYRVKHGSKEHYISVVPTLSDISKMTFETYTRDALELTAVKEYNTFKSKDNMIIAILISNILRTIFTDNTRYMILGYIY